jgi:hypothetical protein
VEISPDAWCGRAHPKPFRSPQHRSSSASSRILESQIVCGNSLWEISDLHRTLGLTAPRITRRFFFTFTENPAKATAFLLTNQTPLIFPSPKVE